MSQVSHVSFPANNLFPLCSFMYALLSYENVAYGTTITPDFTPTYSGVGKAEDYTFTGWSPSLANITADIDSYAQFEFNGLYFRLLMDGTLFAYEDTQGVITSLAPYAFAGESYFLIPNLLSRRLNTY